MADNHSREKWKPYLSIYNTTSTVKLPTSWTPSKTAYHSHCLANLTSNPHKEYRKVKQGVSQGGMLSPLLFTIYLRDISTLK